MKKIGVLFFAGIISLILTGAFASAGPVEDINNVIGGIVEIAEPITKLILGETADVGDIDASSILFGKVLIAILITLIVWNTVSKLKIFEENATVRWAISVVVAILGVRFLTPEFIILIAMPSSALAVTLTTVLPIAVLFFALEPIKIKQVRQVGWILFGVAFLALYFIRYDELGKIVWVYPVAAGVSILMLILDGTIQRFMLDLELRNVGKETAEEAGDEYKERLAKLPKLVTSGALTQAEADKRKKEYLKKLAWLASR